MNRPMRDAGTIAADLLKCALSHEPDVMLVGNVMACEVAALAARQVATCPECGSESRRNGDCNLCWICTALQCGEVPYL